MSLDRFALATLPGTTPIYSQYGYCIHPDGTVYALTGQFFHGVVLCFLFPDVALANGYALPANRDEMEEFCRAVPSTKAGESPHVQYGVYAYQNFELDFGKQLNCLRVSNNAFVGVAVDRGVAAATPEQIVALRAVFNELDVGLRDRVQTNMCELKVSEMWDYLVAPNDPFPFDFRKTKDPYDD